MQLCENLFVGNHLDCNVWPIYQTCGILYTMQIYMKSKKDVLELQILLFWSICSLVRKQS